jgi:hypothetical protein
MSYRDEAGFSLGLTRPPKRYHFDLDGCEHEADNGGWVKWKSIIGTIAREKTYLGMCQRMDKKIARLQADIAMMAWESDLPDHDAYGSWLRNPIGWEISQIPELVVDIEAIL